MEISTETLATLSGNLFELNRKMFDIGKLIFDSEYLQIVFRKQFEDIKLQQREIEKKYKEISDKMTDSTKLMIEIGGK